MSKILEQASRGAFAQLLKVHRKLEHVTNRLHRIVAAEAQGHANTLRNGKEGQPGESVRVF